MDLPAVLNVAVAAGVGLAVGIEREWSGHASGPDARFAGLRTFALLGALAGVAGWLLATGRAAAAIVLLAGATALVVAAYVVVTRRPEASTGGTTETAALIVLALGTLAGLGERAFAAGAVALLVLGLAEKSRLHRWLRALDEAELRGALAFAVLALVVLPLLPDTRYGPYGAIRPRELWTVVLLFSALNFAGYVARHVVGAARGYAVTGLVGGLLSSTAVTLSHSRTSRAAAGDPEAADGLALGVVAACTVLLPRVVVVTLILAPAVAPAVIRYLAAPFVVGVGVIAFVLRDAAQSHSDADGADGADDADAADAAATTGTAAASPAPGNPLGLRQSLQMAVLFQLVLLAVAWMREHVGAGGVLAGAAVLGFTDMDSLTLAMARLAEETHQSALAAQAMTIGVASNTLFKLLLVLGIGRGAFRRRAGLGLAGLLLAVIGGAAAIRWLLPTS